MSIEDDKRALRQHWKQRRKAITQQRRREAAEEGLEPYVPGCPDAIDFWQRIRLPNIGYLEPDGWERTEQSWFVDKTGWGRTNEPALTLEQFKKELHNYIRANSAAGYAVTQEGEHQLVVSAFKRTNEE